MWAGVSRQWQRLLRERRGRGFAGSPRRGWPEQPVAARRRDGRWLLRFCGRLREPVFVLSLLLAGIILLPVFIIVGSIFMDSGEVWEHLAATVLWRYSLNSLLLAGGAGLGALLIGVPLAWLVTFYAFPGRRFFEWMLLLPMAVPTYLIAYCYTDLFDFAGPIQTTLRDWTGWGVRDYWFPEIRSMGGAITLFALVLYPYVYLFCRAAFTQQAAGLVDAARTLGCPPGAIFRQLGIPLARPAIAGGVTLVVMESLADYGAVDYFAIDTFTTGIYRTWAGMGSPVGAAQLSALLLFWVLVFLGLERLSRGRRRFVNRDGQTGLRRPQDWQLSLRQRLLASLACALPIFLGFLLPVGVLLRPAWIRLLNGETAGFATLARNSFSLAALAALLAVAVSLLLAYNNRRHASMDTKFLQSLCGLGYAVPGAVIAIGVMLMFGQWDKLASKTVLLPVLGGSLAGLLLAYLVRFLAVALNATHAGLQKIPDSLDETARILKASGWRILFAVHLPLLRSSILVAALLVFVDVLKELPATLIIRPFNFDTLAIRVYHLASDERLAEAALPALVIIAVGLIPVYVLVRLMGGKTVPMVTPTTGEAVP